MKRLLSAVATIAALGLAAGCGGTSAPRDTAPADLTGTGVTTEIAPTASAPSQSSGEGGGRTENSERPGAPGSPITYDHTRLGASPPIAKADIEGDIRRGCPDGSLCGVKVVISGLGECISTITHSPVKPGGTVTIRAVACKSEVTEESTTSESPSPSSEQPSETTSG